MNKILQILLLTTVGTILLMLIFMFLSTVSAYVPNTLGQCSNTTYFDFLESIVKEIFTVVLLCSVCV